MVFSNLHGQESTVGAEINGVGFGEGKYDRVPGFRLKDFGNPKPQKKDPMTII